MNIQSLREWVSSWGDGPNWSDASGATIPTAKATLLGLLDSIADITTARDKLAAECEDLRKQSESWRMAHFAWQQWGDRMRDVVHCSANGDEPTREAIEHRARSWRDQRDSARTRALKAEADRDRLRALLAEAVEIAREHAAHNNDDKDVRRLAAIAKEGLT